MSTAAGRFKDESGFDWVERWYDSKWGLCMRIMARISSSAVDASASRVAMCELAGNASPVVASGRNDCCRGCCKRFRGVTRGGWLLSDSPESTVCASRVSKWASSLSSSTRRISKNPDELDGLVCAAPRFGAGTFSVALLSPTKLQKDDPNEAFT